MPTKTMSFSIANRRQLYTCNMAEAIVLMFQDLVLKPDPEIMRIIYNIKTPIQIIQNKLHHGPTIRLKRKDLEKYKETIKKIQMIVDKIIGTSMNVSLNFIAGIISLVSDQADEVEKYSKNKNYVEAWKKLTLGLQQIYELYDGQLEDTESCETGAILSNEIKKIIEDCR